MFASVSAKAAGYHRYGLGVNQLENEWLAKFLDVGVFGIETREKAYIYHSEIFSFPSLIKLYRISTLLFIPINNPKQIINIKSNTMVASTAAELSTCIIPSRLPANKPPINKTYIIRRDAVPIMYA